MRLCFSVWKDRNLFGVTEVGEKNERFGKRPGKEKMLIKWG